MRELKILKIRKLYKVKENYVNENFAFETVFKKDVLKLINRLFHMRSQFQYSRNLSWPIMKN